MASMLSIEFTSKGGPDVKHRINFEAWPGVDPHVPLSWNVDRAAIGSHVAHETDAKVACVLFGRFLEVRGGVPWEEEADRSEEERRKRGWEAWR